MPRPAPADITVETLRDLLDYNPETGVILWIARPLSMFSGGPKLDAAFQWAIWNERFAGRPAGSIDARGYRVIKILGRVYKAHRIAWALYRGYWPEHEIDHDNRVRSDNRICNLKNGSNNSRNKNRYSNNKSGSTGVKWNRKSQKWEAQIGGSFGRYIGMFTDKSAAIAARNIALKENNYHANHGKN